MNKNKEVKFRLTEMEFTILNDKAKESNLSVSDFIRNAIFPRYEEYYISEQNGHMYCINYKDNTLSVRTDDTANGEWIDDTPEAVLKGFMTIGEYFVSTDIDNT